MKAPLSVATVNQMSVELMPVIKNDTITAWQARTERTPYIVFDTARAAPVGFGVKVGAKRKTFIVQRRVGSRVLKISLGPTTDYSGMKEAYAEAGELAREALALGGQNPRRVAKIRERQASVASMTVDYAMDIYRKHLVHRESPAKPSSLKNFDLARRRLDREGIKLAHRELGSLTDADVVDAFDALATSPRPPNPRNPASKEMLRPKDEAGDQLAPRGIRTAAEQTFRWASRAVAFVLEVELRTARQRREPPSLAFNPFDALRIHKRYRSRKTLEKSYTRTGARNPLYIRDGSLGRFLDALWERRKTPNNRTAADYLLLTLLWGSRRGEAASLAWRDRISDSQAQVRSWVDLEAQKVHFADTKNNTDHELPLSPGAMNILRERHALHKKSEWVFPARSPKAVQGHYLDSKSILAGIRKSANIPVLRTHDIRRTFTTIAEEFAGMDLAKRLVNHRSSDSGHMVVGRMLGQSNVGDVTSSYISVDDARLRESMARVEREIMLQHPPMARALLPVEMLQP